MQKLELIHSFKKMYGDKIHTQLLSIKYCQTENNAYIKMKFLPPLNNETINLNFITDEESNINPYFNPLYDIVDNANLFLHLDPIILINCIPNLLNAQAEEEINTAHLNSLKENSSKEE